MAKRSQRKNTARGKKQTSSIRNQLSFAQRAMLHLDTLGKVAQLRGLASMTPSVNDAEVIVCFADIRGFTDYCRRLQEDSHDRKIQNFLRRYFSIFAEGLVVWQAKWDAEAANGQVRPGMDAVRHYLAPAMFKNLGDGMMLVWEVPNNVPPVVDGQMAREVVTAIEFMSTQFYSHFRDLNEVEKDSFSELVKTLDIGFSIARGHAWRLGFPHGIDYAGSIVNLTSRLLEFARPRGLVVQHLMSQALLDERVQRNEGRLASIKNLKGFQAPVRVWLSSDVDVSQTDLDLDSAG